MDALRHFQHAQAFRLLAQDLAGTLTVERLADHLSALADVVLDGDARARSGRRCAAPTRRRRGSRSSATASWAARSWATRPTSTSCSSTTTPTTTPARRALRAARAAAHHLAHQHDRGRPALRHRPAAAPRRRGRAAGVARCARFRKYQRDAGVDVGAPGADARALRRRRRGDRRGLRGGARGDPAAAARSGDARAPTSSRCAARCATAIRNPTAAFDLKHDPGGMVDVEFAVQYLVLAHAHRAPGADAQRWATSRCSGSPATWGSSRRRLARRRRRRLSRVPPPAAPDPADRRRRTRASTRRRRPPRARPSAALWTHVFGDAVAATAPWRAAPRDRARPRVAASPAVTAPKRSISAKIACRR